MRNDITADLAAFHKDEGTFWEELYALCEHGFAFWKIGMDFVGNAKNLFDIAKGHDAPGSHDGAGGFSSREMRD